MFPAFLIACGGEGSTSDENATPEVEQATEADMEAVNQTQSLEQEADEVNQDVDSILNNL